MQFRVLTPPAVTGPSGSRIIKSARQSIILSMFGFEMGRFVTFHRLIEAIWGSNPPETARGQIHICISELRKVIKQTGAAGRIDTSPSGYVFHCPTAELDIELFRSSIESARNARKEGSLQQALRDYLNAFKIWPESSSRELGSQLLESVMAGLMEQHAVAVEEYCELGLMIGEPGRVTEVAAPQLARHPLRERLRELHIRALCQMGRRAEALEIYREGRDLLIRELGINPSPSLQALHMEVLAE